MVNTLAQSVKIMCHCERYQEMELESVLELLFLLVQKHGAWGWGGQGEEG